MRQYLKTYQVAGNVTPRLYDTAMEEYKFFQENPAAWSEDPDMKNPDGSFNLCLDCIKVDWTNPEHIKDAYRLIEEGYSRGTHYNHDDFVKGYQTLGLPEPVYNKAKMQSSTEGLPGKRSGGEMIRRADGSYSPRGFWDNIRANIGSGKEPTKQMRDTEEKLNSKADGGIHIDPSKKGTFKAQATRMGMSVAEAASHILANKGEYSPEMVKKAVFAHNFANQYGGLVDDFDKYMDGGKIELPKAVVGAIVPMAMQLLGSGAAAGAGAGAAGAGSAIAGAAGKSAITGAAKSGLMSGIKNQFANAKNSPSINSSNLAGAAALPDTGPLSWLKAAVGAGTALSSAVSTFTNPTGGGMLGKYAGKSDFGTPGSVMQTQKLGAPEKQNSFGSLYGVNASNAQMFNDYAFKNQMANQQYNQMKTNNFMVQPGVRQDEITTAPTFGEGMPLKQQVGPIAGYAYGGHLPMYQGVDMFGNFTTGIVGNNVGMQMNMNEIQNVLNQAVGAKTVDQSYANNTANILAKDAAAEENRKSIQAAIAEQNKKPESPIQPTGSTPNTGFDKTMGFISGMNMFNTVLEANQNKKARQKWERQNSYNTDSTYNPMVVDNPFGLYDPNTGQMKPGSKVATQDFGTTGVAKCGGQKMYRQGGTYMLSKEEIMDILAKGGEIEFM